MMKTIRRFSLFHLTVLLVFTAILPTAIMANVVWDESVDGDLSNDPNQPTLLNFSPGSNVIIGSMASPNDQRDYLTFTLGAGESLVGLWLLQYEDLNVGGPGNLGFHAINAGATSFIPSAATAGNFLGGDHVAASQVGTDMLPVLAAAPLAGSGFTVPLGPGTYSYVIQQTGPELTGYTLDFVVVPEPATALLGTLICAAVCLLCNRRYA